MIPRYSRAQMSQIWSDEARFKIWLEIETLALEQMAKEGLAPQQAVADLKSRGRFEATRVLKIEEEVKHDVIAFLTNVAQYVGENSRFIHRGMTSSDVLDTSLAVQLKRSGELLLSDLDDASTALLARAEEYKYTPCIGRSHGIHAEPSTFGLKLVGWLAELKRQKSRLQIAVEEIACGKIAGAVGTYASVSPEVEAYVLTSLGLRPEAVPTQIVARDRHANFFNVLAQIATSLERFAVEIRHLQRTEVREAEERFTVGQKGSSAMPHKRNPILSENISGLARLMRGYAQSALDNVVLWHERDISHSSVERVIAPDACILMDFMLARFTSLIKGLQVYPKRMLENLDFSRGLVFSGSLLLALADSGLSREDAYRLVQKHALAVWDGGPDLKARVLADIEITQRITAKEVEAVFDLARHFKHVDMIFDRAVNS